MKVFGVVGWKNSGKTALVERLVAEFTRRGLAVSTIKHAHHSFDVDHPGRDSHRHRMAGARQVLLSSRKRWALMSENGEARPEAAFKELLAKLDPVDLVLVEGFKSEAIPKVEAHRHQTGQDLIARQDTGVLAIASDVPLADVDVPVIGLDETGAIADFIAERMGLNRARAANPRDALDCFALPPGVDWVPFEAALDQLKGGLAPVAEVEACDVKGAGGRILASDVKALRANPPLPNTAVDGWAFAGRPLGAGEDATFEVVEGRAAPGAAFAGQLRAGQAVRVLTGGPLPNGADTVALQEHSARDGGLLSVYGPLKVGENTRKAGEDFGAGDVLLSGGRRLLPPDLALLMAGGVAEVSVHRPLRVGVLSTGNELFETGQNASAAGIYDANRPMLLDLVRQWGHTPVDLGICRDTRAEVEAALGNAATRVDVLLTSGGASAGDEDFLARAIETLGTLNTWRIAIKPGRPLALGAVGKMPVVGLPGNPVAALVCALLFARPALQVMAGAGWSTPQGYWMPAGFAKSKKAGRREFLRARVGAGGRVERFKSEGSGRVSGLSWAGGLVELPDEAMSVAPGDMVRFIPYSSFGLV